jgi:O-methyltransferase
MILSPRRFATYLESRKRRNQFRAIHNRYKPYSMTIETWFYANLELASQVKDIPGAVVECGVWRGGMIAAIAHMLGPDREYVLCDSFEGLPPAREIDGETALAWQQDKDSPWYHDNCRAEQRFAQEAMQLAGAKHVRIEPGWFDATLPGLEVKGGIALLRLDADWYESTMTCLTCLADQVVPGGIIILDDYQVWDGCSRAVHDFLSSTKLAWRVSQWDNCVPYVRVPVAPRQQDTPANGNGDR